jgi:Zn-dependent peptidase ImmA (M78 family)
MAGQASRNGATGARNLRVRRGLPLDGRLPDLLTLVEDGCGVPVVVLPRLHGDLAGGYYKRGEKRVIIVNADDPVSRMRFTLAHELGHHYFHHLERVAELQGATSIQDTRADLRYAHDWWEVQANAFAAELLIPAPALKRWDEERTVKGVGLDAVADLACSFGTSLTMACYRLSTAGALPDDEWLERLKVEISSGEADHLLDVYEPLEDGLSRARECAPRVPPGLQHTVGAAVASGRRSVEDAAAVLGCDVAGFENTMADLDLLASA